jgi:outer membrane protein assembly complex protein YaeT
MFETWAPRARAFVRRGAAATLIVGAAALATARPASGQDQGLVIRRLDFRGNRSISSLALRAAIANTGSSTFASWGILRWLGLGEKRRLNEREFRADAARIRLFYQRSGFLDARVDTLVRRTDRDVFITFRIDEGEPSRVRTLSILGLDSVPDPALARRDLPLRVGMPYNRYLLEATADTLQSRLRDRGFPTASVLVGRREVDRVGRTADLELFVDPGRPATVGSIRVEGAREVDTAFIRSLLATEPGRPYRQSDLYRSQLHLYRSGLFRYATVVLDTFSFTIGDPAAPLVVQVEEGGLHRARAAVGFGTNDCFRTSLGWTARNVSGRGRAFDVTGQLSKIGVGDGPPFGFSAERSWVCGTLNRDSIGSRDLNFALSTSLRQPGFLSPANAISVSLFAERRSEFLVYLREDVGTSVTFTRESARRIPIGLTYRVSYGATRADAVSFCSVFNACTREDVARLEERRVQATLTGTLSRQRVNNLLDPTRGSVYSLEATHSSRPIGSSRLTEFTRAVAAATWYRPLGGEVVLAANLRAGLVFAPRLELGAAAGNFVPPEQRFYAGGANDVRGFDRNELGPVVYVVDKADLPETGDPDPGTVRVAPTGGNALAVGNVELRLPSPVARDRVRWALFVDAGTVWERGLPNSPGAAIRVTPGFGIRLATPLGPARLDVAYNGSDLPRGNLYSADAATGALELVRSGYQRSSDRSRINLQVSVGQAF